MGESKDAPWPTVSPAGQDDFPPEPEGASDEHRHSIHNTAHLDSPPWRFPNAMEDDPMSTHADTAQRRPQDSISDLALPQVATSRRRFLARSGAALAGVTAAPVAAMVPIGSAFAEADASTAGAYSHPE